MTATKNNKIYLGGYCDINDIPIKIGDVVVIKKGTRIINMNVYKRSFFSKKNYKITVKKIFNGVHNKLSNPLIAWRGSGGYLYMVDINEVLTEDHIKLIKLFQAYK